MNSNSRFIKASLSFFLLAVLFFSTNVSFSQNNISINNQIDTLIAIEEPIVVGTASTREVSLETNFSFVSWFMGTKQSLNDNKSKEATSTKKLLINSGVAPNRILMKTFLKKAQNQASSVA